LYSGPIAGSAAAEAQRLSSGSALGALGNRGGTAADAGGEGALGNSLRAMKDAIRAEADAEAAIKQKKFGAR
jgi:hypothetical protein